jgi:hypothetical protein
MNELDDLIKVKELLHIDLFKKYPYGSDSDSTLISYSTKFIIQLFDQDFNYLLKYMTDSDKYKIYEYCFIGGLKSSIFYLHPPNDGFTNFEIIQLVDKKTPNAYCLEDIQLFANFIKKGSSKQNV